MPLSSLHEPFPIKLHGMLNDVDRHPDLKAIISWNDEGTSFTVHQPKLFASTIMLRYFSHTKYKSFQRQMNLYHFSRISRGQRRNTYAHDYFIRSNAALCKYICRTTKGKPASMPIDDAEVAAMANGSDDTTELTSIMPITLDSIYRQFPQDDANKADTKAKAAPAPQVNKNNGSSRVMIQQPPIDVGAATLACNVATSTGASNMGGSLTFDFPTQSRNLAPIGVKTADLDTLLTSDLLNMSSGSLATLSAFKSDRSFDQDFWQLSLPQQQQQQRPIELSGNITSLQSATVQHQYQQHQQQLYPTLDVRSVMRGAPLVMTMQNVRPATAAPAAAAAAHNNNNDDDDLSIGTIDDIQSNVLPGGGDVPDSSVIAV